MKAKNMLSFRRLAGYFLAYLILMIISSLVASKNVLIPLDQTVLRTFQFNKEIEEKFKNKVLIIDLPHRSDSAALNLGEFREHLAILLDTLANRAEKTSKKPVIILDITFKNAEDGIPALTRSLSRLKNDKVPIYGAYKIPARGESISFEDHDGQQYAGLYDEFFNGRKHTRYNEYDDDCLLSFDSFKTIGVDKIESLIVRVANDYYGVDRTDFQKAEIPALPLENINSYETKTYEFIGNDKVKSNGKFPDFSTAPDISDTFVIVGVSGVDTKSKCNMKIPGPYLLARGLTNRLQNNELTKEAHEDILMQIGIALFFGLIVCLFYALIYKYIIGLKTRPLLISGIAFFVGLLLLIGFGFAMIKYAVIRPSLPLLSMFWAVILAWQFAKKFLVTGIIKGRQIYDIFISYSHGDTTWVKRHLYKPLTEILKPDGSKFNIFFDEKSIRLGELFTSKYMRGIVDSRMFIPVMSEEYYDKNHCRNEMDLAVKRHIEKNLHMCIVALGFENVPEEFTNINMVDANVESNLVKRIKNELLQMEAESDSTVEKSPAPETAETVDSDGAKALAEETSGEIETKTTEESDQQTEMTEVAGSAVKKKKKTTKKKKQKRVKKSKSQSKDKKKKRQKKKEKSTKKEKKKKDKNASKRKKSKAKSNQKKKNLKKKKKK